MKTIFAWLVLSVVVCFSQTATSLLDGTVTDPQGSAVVGADVTVTNADTAGTFKTKTDQNGHWRLPSMAAGTYRMTVSAKGFRTTSVEGIQIASGIPSTANAKLEIGSVTEVISVEAGAELLQTSTATVASTVQQRQVQDLPFTSRGGMDLLVTQPGVQTGSTARTSFINGLPLSAINITIDGINSQDNYYKNGDGFFSVIPVRQDSLEEITLSTSASGVDNNGQGAAQVRFITKGGTNEFHGGAFWQHRNTALDANSYFNNINNLERNRVILNQGGVHVGGPIWKNKLFFFTNYEIYRYPAQTTTTRTVINPAAMNGDYTYPIAGGGTRTVNVLQLAQQGGFTSTVDPIIGQTLNQINGLTKNGTLQSRVQSNSDYNRSNLFFQPSGLTKYWTDSTRLDYNISSKHSLQVVWTYYANSSVPDITNSVVPIYPGTGAVLGYDNLVPSQGGNRYAVSVALRSSLTPTLTNELRFGLNRSVTIFRGEVSSPSLFAEWKGYCPTLGFSLTNVASVCGSSRRTSPVRELHDTISKAKGSHLLTFGVDISQINLWYQTVGTSVIPTISFSGLATGDPANTGSTGLFTASNFPGASSSNLSDAAALYAMLTGRVASISRSLAYDGTSYKSAPPTERDRQWEWGLYAQDSWKVKPSLTLTLGLRFEQQRPFQNLDGVYSGVSYQSVWGISGVGNLFAPGVMTGVNPTFDKYNSDYYKIPKMWSPSVGLAWQLPGVGGPLGFLLGHEKGKSVLRAGYGISTIRNGSNTFQSLLGSNQGLNYSTSVDPSNYPTDFGAPGSVLFRGALPVRSNVPNSPQYPISPLPTNSLNGYDPNLKMPYVQSWNIGLQRQLSRNTAIEVRYTGNHGLKLWRQINLNEVNLFENGFLKEFYQAQQNLWINRGCRTSWTDCSGTTTSFANAGLPGQGPIPIISTGLGYTSDTNVSNYLRQNRAGSVAGLMYNNTAAMNRLVNAGYPKNMFVVNPAVPSGGTYLLTNMGSSFYNALQVEVTRRMASGFQFQASYVWSHSIVNGSQDSLTDSDQPTTLRNLALDRIPGEYDIRHAIKINGIYELPFGTKRKFLASAPSPIRKVIDGWQISGIGRLQSGSPVQLTSGRNGMNNNETGVVLYNMTASQLQDMMKIRKTTASNGVGLVSFLPDSLIQNTNAAFEVNSLDWKNLDTSAPYIGPQLAPDQFGYQIFLRNPWQYHLDLAATKRTTIHERLNVEFQVNFIDALNLTNFFIASGGSASTSASAASFGRTTSAFNDFSGSADPGNRIIEFRLKLNF